MDIAFGRRSVVAVVGVEDAPTWTAAPGSLDAETAFRFAPALLGLRREPKGRTTDDTHLDAPGIAR